MLKKFLWVLVLTVMILIFRFSSQEATISNQNSLGVTEKIVNLSPKIRQLPNYEKIIVVKKFNNTVRKYAHFTLFFILGGLVFLAISCYRLSFFKTIFISFSTCLGYAVSDEIHQLFVPGRGCQATDVLIDFSGAILGILLVLAISKLIFFKIKKISIIKAGIL